MITLIIRPMRLSAIGLISVAISVSIAAQDKSKTFYGLLLDSTGSMRSQFQTVLDIGKGVVHQAAAHGPVSIFSFASQGIGKDSRAVPVVRIEPSRDEATLNRTIEGTYVQGGQTAL